MYDPGTANEWKSAMAAQVGDAMRALGMDPVKVCTPLWLAVEFYLPRPKYNLCKSGLRSSAPRHHLSKPDTDNLLKTIDGLHGVRFEDDRSVVSMYATKQYADDGQAPGARLRVGVYERSPRQPALPGAPPHR